MGEIVVNTPDAPRILAGYSQAVKVAGLIFVSGHGPFDAKAGNVVGTMIQEQTALDILNLNLLSIEQNIHLNLVLSIPQK